MLRRITIIFAFAFLLIPYMSLAQGSWNWIRTAYADDPTPPYPMLMYSGVEMWLMSRGGTVNSTNLYVAGMFTNGHLAFGTDTLTNSPGAGWWNTSVAKYDSAGNVLWALCGSQGASKPMAITTDPFGNLYVYGAFFTDKVRFGAYEITSPATGTPTIYTSSYLYLLKIDSNGNVKWLKNGGKVNSIAAFAAGWNWAGGGIVSDSKGNIYVSGNYDSTLTIGSFTLTNTSVGNGDVFVAKFDSSGNALWAKKMGGSGYDGMGGMAISPKGKLYVGGYFESSLTLGSTTLNATSDKSIFLVQMDTAGNIGWARQGNGTGFVNCITIDKKENVYIAGDVIDPTVTFGGVTIHSPYGAYMVKYDSAGTAIWGKSFNNPVFNMSNRSTTYSLATDDSLNVWATVDFRDSAMLSTTKTAYRERTTIPTAMVEYSKDGDLRDYTVVQSGGDDNSTVFINNQQIYFMVSVFGDTTVIQNDTIFSHSAQDQFMLGRYNKCVTCLAGVKEDRLQSEDLLLYPNPSNDICIIKSTKVLPVNTRADIYDAAGRIVKSVALSGTNITISIADLVGGTYVVRLVSTDGSMAVKKLVVLKRE